MIEIRDKEPGFFLRDIPRVCSVKVDWAGKIPGHDQVTPGTLGIFS